MTLTRQLEPLPTGDPKVRARQARALAVNAAGTMLLCLGAGAWVLTAGQVLGGVALILSGVPATVVLVRAARRIADPRFELGEEGALLVLPFSTERYELDDVDRFEVAREERHVMVVLVTADGSRRGVPGLGRSAGSEGAAEADAEALNRRLAALRGF
jgi:hypothetical protein